MIATLAQRLHALRLGRQLTLGQLATALNQEANPYKTKPNTEAQIGRWERGNRMPAYPELIKMAQYFNVTIDYLVGRADSNDEDIATAFMADKQLLFEDHALSQRDRYEIYQLIKGYLHGKTLNEKDTDQSKQYEISLPLDEKDDAKSIEMSLHLEEDDSHQS